MKKFLTMALALMMILSLFAVPTMASSTVENEMIYDGGFETYGSGYVLTKQTGVTNHASSGKVDTVVSTVTNEKAFEGSKSLKFEASVNPSVRTSTFAIEAGDYVAKFAIYATLPYEEGGTTANGRLSFANARTPAPTWGEATLSAGIANPSASWYFDFEIPTNQWVSFEVPVTFNANVATSYLDLGLSTQQTLSEFTTFGYFDGISLTKQATGYALTIDEKNDFGAVFASPGVAADGTANIFIMPNEGYYVHEIKVAGTNVTSDLAKKYVSLYREPYYLYTVNGADLSADATVEITYGYYTYQDMFEGGDGEAETGVYNGTVASGWTMSVSDEAHNGGGHSIKVSKTGATSAQTAALNTPYPNPYGYDPATDTTRFYTTGEYLVSFDVMSPTAYTDTRLDAPYPKAYSYYADYTGANYVLGSSRGDSMSSPNNWITYKGYLNVVNKDDATDQVRFSMRLSNVSPDADGNVVVYYDNFTVKKMTKAGAAPVAPVVPPVVEPTTAAVTGTTNNEAYGTVTPATSTVELGEAVTFTVTPKLGYYVAAATLNGENVLGSFDAYEGGTYTVAEVAEDVELAVEFAAVAAKGENIATLTDSFVAADTAVTFGKVLDRTDATSWGIELKKDGVGVTPYHGGSYLYKALATNANGQYAIEFIGLEAGEYTIRSYVFVNGVATFGAPSTFVVE